jgi:methylenetetrahydrofolate dehydrogenase (NADP+)/methenyltetrahydrofolate cyclohydrolase
MRGHIIDGAAVAREVRDEVAREVAALEARGITPGLAVVIVGENAASQVYVRNKVRTAESLGLRSQRVALPASVSQAELMATVAQLNAAPDVHGFLVQMPLPQHLDAGIVPHLIDPAKDVDGFHRENVGALVLNEPGLRPCTPLGVMRLLEHAEVTTRGAHAVVVGRSNIVGKPMSMLLLHAGATVTICHSQTRDLPAIAREADILVAAVGRPRFVTRDMVKPGAVVIDVGINRDADGRLCGDVDFEGVRDVASAITPVPGGVGPMTVAMLMSNTVAAAARLH